MTEQVKETIIYNNQEYKTYSYPDLSEEFKLKSVVNAQFSCTACHRNYIGTWEITNNKLFLKKISGFGESIVEPMFANWFSGEIIIPGNLNTEPDKVYTASYSIGVERPSQYTYFHFKEGVLTEIDIKNEEDTHFCTKNINAFIPWKLYQDNSKTGLLQKLKNFFHLN